MSGFDFDIEHVSRNKNLSDILSRLPIASGEDTVYDVDILLFIREHLPVKSLIYDNIKAETRKDKELALVMAAIKRNNVANLKSTNFNAIHKKS